MDKAIRSVLVVGTELTLHERLEPLLRRRHFDVDRVQDSAAAQALVEAVAIDILVLSGSLRNPAVGDLLKSIRRPESPCLHSAVLVFSDGDELQKEHPHVGPTEFTRYLSNDATDEELDDAVAALLRESPRLSVRLNIRIETQLGHGPTMVLTQTENVSLGGMLVRMTRPQPVDSTLRFELLLPAGFPVLSGVGQVVRHTQDWQGHTTGVGMRFISFNGDGRRLLEHYLEHSVSQH